MTQVCGSVVSLSSTQLGIQNFYNGKQFVCSVLSCLELINYSLSNFIFRVQTQDNPKMFSWDSQHNKNLRPDEWRNKIKRYCDGQRTKQKIRKSKEFFLVWKVLAWF